MHSHTGCTSLHRVRRGNCCIFALHMAYAAGANASVTAITSASAAPIAVVCSASKRLALTVADLGVTSAVLDPATLSGLWPGPGIGPDAMGANGTGMTADARLAGEPAWCGGRGAAAGGRQLGKRDDRCAVRRERRQRHCQRVCGGGARGRGLPGAALEDIT